MFLIFGLEIIFNKKIVAMFRVYLRAKFHVTICNCSIIATLKPTAIYTFDVLLKNNGKAISVTNREGP
jgi:hypothetical protein